MFTNLDNTHNSVLTRKQLLTCLLDEYQQGNQSLINQLIEYYFQKESLNAFLLIKEFCETGKEQTKVSDAPESMVVSVF